MTNSPSRVRHITGVARDDVKVGVGDCLAGRFSAIGSDIKAVRLVLVEKKVSHNTRQVEAGRIRLVGQIK